MPKKVQECDLKLASIKDKVTICAWVYLWSFYPVPLIYVTVFMSISYCFYYSSFAIQFEIRKHDTSSFILLSQGCFDYLGSFILQFLHSPSKEHFSCFQVLAIMNKATINMCAGFCVDISFQLLWVNTKECDCWIVW